MPNIGPRSASSSRGWLNLWQCHLAAASLVAPPKPQLGAASRDATTRCRLYLSVWTEPTQPVLSGQTGLPVSARLYGQAVDTESVHS